MQACDGPRCSLSEQCFELGKSQFNRIEVGAVRRQEDELGAGCFDGLLDARHFVALQIIQDDDVARLEGGSEEALDVGAKGLPIHRPIEQHRSG